MTWITGHPGYRRLSRFADGELGAREQERVASHLAACPRCREEVALIRRMADAARQIPAPPASERLLQQALARRAAGERVLLPTSDAGAPSKRRPRTGRTAAIAAMLTLLVGSLVYSVQLLEADRPALRIQPKQPVQGEVLRVEYHGGALFADQTHLKLRARYRTATDRQWQLLAGILVRGDDGRYRTEVALPDSVVYAAFAVEDLYGERLDSNNRQLWDVMLHGDNGRPTLDALTARLRDLERRDWGEAYDVAREMTEIYPDEPRSWAIRFSYELSLFDRDSVFAEHSEQFRRLEKQLSEEPRPDPASMGWLASYALGLGDIASGSTWVARAVDEGRHLPVVAEAEMMLLAVRHDGEYEKILSEMERLWMHIAGGSLAVANYGWQTARKAGSGPHVRVWLERYLQLRPNESPLLFSDAVAAAPEMMPRARDWANKELERIEQYAQGLRPLESSPANYVRRETEELQGSLAEMAHLALENGDPGLARRLAMSGSQLGWNSRALLEIGEALLSLGDTAAAIPIFARAAADPLTTSAAVHRGAPLLSTRQAWNTRVARAEQDLRAYVMETAILRYLPDHLELSSQSNNVLVTNLLEERVTVVVFMSRYSAPALEEIGSLQVLSQTLEDMRTGLILVDLDNTGALASLLAEVAPELQVFSDYSGAVRTAFGNSAAPEVFVVDQAARIRFESSRLEEVLRQVESLQRLRPNELALAQLSLNHTQ